MTKYLILKGCAGLGNRLFCVLDALDYCIKTKRILLVDWSDGQFSEKYNNIFNDFFEIDHPLFFKGNIKELVDVSDCYPKSWNNNLKYNVYDLFDIGTPKKHLIKIPFLKHFIKKSTQLWVKNNLIDKYGSKVIYDQKKMDFCQNVTNRISKYGIIDLFKKSNMSFGNNLSYNISNRVVVYADFSPPISNKSLVKHLSIKPTLNNNINEWVVNKLNTENSLGVHIRNTDKKPTEDFNKLISYIKCNYPDYQVFLATDDYNVEELFSLHFDNFLTFGRKKIENVNNKGIHFLGLEYMDNDLKREILISSIYDIWILSRCKTLFYQGNSSFSVFSSIMHSDESQCFDWLKLIK